MAKKRRSSQFKDTSQVIDIEEARRKRQEKRKKQMQAQRQEENGTRTVRASIKAARRKKKALYAVIILAIITAIGVSIFNIVSLKAEQREIKEEQKRLLDEKKELEQQIEDSSDPVYIEDAAREVLRMVNPGETIYVVDIVD